MQPKIIALVLAYIAATVASPAEQPTTGSNYVELFREPAKLSNGTIIWYGPDTSAAEPKSKEKRLSCSTAGTAPTCDSDNAARNSVCDSLIGELNSDASVSVPQAPRQICYQGSSGDNPYCCVSWNTVVPGLTKGDLAGPSQTIASKCTSNGVSGLISSVRLHNTCSKLCLSNRGNEC